MSLTIFPTSQPRFQRIAPPPGLQPALALPALAAAIFLSLAPVEDPHPLKLPGQSCQTNLAAAEATLDAHERDGEVVLVIP